MNAALADLDAQLARYRAAADTISTNLLELDHDPNRQLLGQAPLRGATAAAWAEASSAITTTWEWYARFCAFLDRAGELRGSPRTLLAPGRERDLADLLSGASIDLRDDDVPFADRGLLQDRTATRCCTGDELLTLMADTFGRARDVVVAVGAVWDEILPRITAVQGRLNLAGPTDASDTELAALEPKVAALTEALATDPLSVNEPDVVAIERRVADLDRSLVAAHELDARLHDELRAAPGVLEAVDAALADAERARQDARAKVVLPADGPPPRDDTDLAGALERIRTLADAGHTRRALDELASWRVSVDARFGDAVEAARAARARLQQRVQLRGRLDAYTAQAHALGLDEDQTVTDAHDRAEAALFTAPTDLDAANDLVFRYQQLVFDESTPGKGLR